MIIAEAALAASWTPLESYDPRGWTTNAPLTTAWPASNHVSWSSNNFLTVSSLFLLQTNIVGHIPNPTNQAALLTITNTVGYYCGTRMPYGALWRYGQDSNGFPILVDGKEIQISMEDWRINDKTVAEFFIQTYTVNMTTNDFNLANPTNVAILNAPDARVWDCFSAVMERQLIVGQTNEPVTWVEFFGRDRWRENVQRIKSLLVSPAALNALYLDGLAEEVTIEHSTNVTAILSLLFLDGRKYDKTGPGFATFTEALPVLYPEDAGEFIGDSIYDAMRWGVDGIWTWVASPDGPGPFKLYGTNGLFSYYAMPKNYGVWTPTIEWAENMKRTTIETNWFYSATGLYSKVATNFLPWPESVDVYDGVTNYTWYGIEDGFNSTDYGLEKIRPMLSDMVTTRVQPGRSEVAYVSVYGTGATYSAAVADCLTKWGLEPKNYSENYGLTSVGYASEGDLVQPGLYYARIETSWSKVYYTPPVGFASNIITVVAFGASNTLCSTPFSTVAGENLVWNYCPTPDASSFPASGETRNRFFSTFYLHADWRPALKYK